MPHFIIFINFHFKLLSKINKSEVKALSNELSHSNFSYKGKGKVIKINYFVSSIEIISNIINNKFDILTFFII